MVEGESISRIAVVVADAGPLIHLDELDCLDLLNDFDHVMVPEAVWVEVLRHRPSALENAIVRLERTVAPACDSALEAHCQLYTLHAGEREAITVCRALSNSTLLTDDTAARLAAQSLRIPAHGTLGILLRALRRRQRDRLQVIALLNAIPQNTTLHIRPSLLAEILEQVRTTSTE